MGDGGRVVGVRRGRVIGTVPGAPGFRVEHGLETVQVIGFDATTARYPVLQIAVQFPLAHIACAHILPTALGGALLFLDARGKNILDFWRRRKLLGVSSPQASEQGREMRRVFRLRGGCHSSFLLGALPARPRAVGHLVQRWIEAAQMEGLRTVVTAQQWPSILTGRTKVLVDHRIMSSSSQHGF